MKTIITPVLLLMLLGLYHSYAQDETNNRRFLSFNIRYERLSTTLSQPYAWNAGADYGKSFTSGWELSAGLGLIRNAFTEKGSIAYLRYDDWIAAFRVTAEYELMRYGRFRWLAGSSLTKFVSLSSKVKWIPIDRLQYPNTIHSKNATLNGASLDMVTRVSCRVHDQIYVSPYIHYTVMHDIGGNLKGGQLLTSPYSMRWEVKKDFNFGLNMQYQIGL